MRVGAANKPEEAAGRRDQGCVQSPEAETNVGAESRALARQGLEAALWWGDRFRPRQLPHWRIMARSLPGRAGEALAAAGTF